MCGIKPAELTFYLQEGDAAPKKTPEAEKQDATKETDKTPKSKSDAKPKLPPALAALMNDEPRERPANLSDDFYRPGLKLRRFAYRKVVRSASSWMEMYEALVRSFYAKDRTIIEQLANNDACAYVSRRKESLTWAVEFANGLYLERNLTPTVRLEILRDLFKRYELKPEALMFDVRPAEENVEKIEVLKEPLVCSLADSPLRTALMCVGRNVERYKIQGTERAVANIGAMYSDLARGLHRAKSSVFVGQRNAKGEKELIITSSASSQTDVKLADDLYLKTPGSVYQTLNALRRAFNLFGVKYESLTFILSDK